MAKSTIKITNHRKAEIHLPVVEKTGAGVRHVGMVTFWPGVNEIPTETWDHLKAHKMARAHLRDESLEVNGKVAKDATPSFQEYVDNGNPPKAYLGRYPKGTASKAEIDLAQAQFDKEQKDYEDTVRGTKRSGAALDDSEDDEAGEENEEADAE